MNEHLIPFEKHQPVRTPLFIGGETVTTSALRTVIDPAQPDQVVGYAASATAVDADSAVQSAGHAFSEWSKLSTLQRADLLAQAIESPAVRSESDARLLTLENGKILRESNIDFAVFEARWKLALNYSNEADRTEVLSSAVGVVSRTEIQWQPLGVVTIIVPFNWPLAILAASLPQALLAGNTVIVKPPLTAPLATTSFLTRIAQQLPAGVLNVVTGENEAIRSLISNTSVAKVCFTGSVSGGREIMRLASTTLTRLTLELGGNDPALIMQDAVLDDTHIDRLFHSIFDSSGQICMNAKRIYVHESRFDELVAGLEQKLQKIQLGHGLDPDTTHGPVHSRKQQETAKELLTEAETMYASVRQYGTLPTTASLTSGFFVRPAIVLDPAKTTRIVNDEPFAPIVPINRFTTEAEAVYQANDTWAGLGASVWTADPQTANRISRQLTTGYVWTNDHGASRLDLRAPFGGMKQSGFGREQGVHGMHEFMDTRVVAVSDGES